MGSPNPDGQRWVEWSPPHAPHVRGRYTERTYDEQGLPEEQRVEVWCEHEGCEHRNEVWRRTCTSGQVRSVIAHYATAHAHRDPLRAERVEHPGSLRRREE